MNVVLSPELEQFVEKSVHSGEFESASEVVSYAVQLLKHQHDELPRGKELERLIAEGQADVDAGRVYSGEEVFAELLKKNGARPRKS